MKMLRSSLALALAILALFTAAGYAAKDDLREILKTAPPSSDYPNSGFINLICEVKRVVKPDGSWSTTSRTVAKICNERGRSIANVSLPYNSAFEKIKVLRARTIRKDGTIVEVKSQDILDVSLYSGYSMYSSARSKVIFMPAVEDDCIIDYEWVVTGKKSIMSGHFWDSWFFQSAEPTMLSRYTLEGPADRKFAQVAYNSKISPVITTSSDGKTETYVWEGRNFDEIEQEPHMPSTSEICPWFEISSVGSWDEVAAWYRKLVEPQMKPSMPIEQAVKGLIEGREAQAEKARMIYYWVEDKIRYVGLELGTGAYEPHSAKDVFDNRYGDCKDQVTLLVTMLRIAGIKAYPALVSTGSKGQTSKLIPSPGIFNHAIAVAEIDGKLFWMDPTGEVCRFGDLPEDDRGSEVLVIKETISEFVGTPEYTADENSTSQKSSIELNADGGIKASVVWASTGSAGISARASYKYARPSSIREGFEATVAAICPDARLANYAVENLMQKDSPLKLTYDFEASGWANRTSKFMFFRPSLYQSVLSQTPFSKPERKYDIVFSGMSVNSSDTTIKLPDGFTVEEIPTGVSLKADFATYDRTYTLEGNILKVSERLVRQDARIPVARYGEVKKFYEDVIKAQKQQVVLKVAG